MFHGVAEAVVTHEAARKFAERFAEVGPGDTTTITITERGDIGFGGVPLVQVRVTGGRSVSASSPGNTTEASVAVAANDKERAIDALLSALRKEMLLAVGPLRVYIGGHSNSRPSTVLDELNRLGPTVQVDSTECEGNEDSKLLGHTIVFTRPTA